MWRGHAAMLLVIGMFVNAAGQAKRADTPEELAIVGARIYSSPEATPIAGGTILIRNGRILAVGPSSEIVVPRSARTLDAHGAVVVAGFWNSHVHLMTPDLLNAAKADARLLQGGMESMFTRWGFTTVFDLASSTDNSLALRARVKIGEVAGPMILTLGDPFYPKGGTPIYVRAYLKAHGFPNEEVASPQEAAARARSQLGRGTDGVKLFSGAVVGGTIGVLPMRLDIARAIVAEAHRRGKPAFAHPGSLAGLDVAIDAGVDILAHTTAMDGGVSSGWSSSLIGRMRAHNMAVIPTMALLEVEAQKSGESAADLAKAISMITDEVRDYGAAGGQILFGTDVGYTDALDPTEEYRLMAHALTWQQILASLTTAPAERFGFAGRKGRIAKGMDADLVVLDRDPAQDPTAFARVRDTIRGGQVLWGKGR